MDSNIAKTIERIGFQKGVIFKVYNRWIRMQGILLKQALREI